MKFHVKVFKQRHYALPLWKRLWSVQEGRCFYCAGRMGLPDKEFHPEAATVDHFFPKYLVGPRQMMNSVLCHRRCNGTKGSRHPTAAELKRFLWVWARVDVYVGEGHHVDSAHTVRISKRMENMIKGQVVHA